MIALDRPVVTDHLAPTADTSRLITVGGASVAQVRR